MADLSGDGVDGDIRFGRGGFGDDLRAVEEAWLPGLRKALRELQ